MKITKHAQSCFLIETKGVEILIDPGYFVFDDEGLKPEAFADVNYILITHEHGDHCDAKRIAEIAKIAKVKILALPVVIDLLKKEIGKNEAEFIAVSDTMFNEFDEITIEAYSSEHGPLPTGKPAPEVIGFVIDDGAERFYTPGDSLYLNPAANATIIATPICGQVVMTIPVAREELLKVMPKLTIAMHYDNKNYPVEPQDYVKAMIGTGIDAKVLAWGQSVEV